MRQVYIDEEGRVVEWRGQPETQFHRSITHHHEGEETMESTTRMVRQGDVLVTRVDSLPEKLSERPRDEGRVILAYGEVTGHCHQVADPGAAALLDAPDGETYLRVDRLSELVHDEHGAIALEPGNYKVTRQREYTPEAIINVAD